MNKILFRLFICLALFHYPPPALAGNFHSCCRGDVPTRNQYQTNQYAADAGMQDAQAQNDASSSNDNDDDGSLNTPQVLPPDFRIADADEAEMLELWSSLRKFLSSGNLGEDEVRRLQSDLRRLSISSNDSIRTQAAEALRRLSVSTELGTAGGAGAAAQAAGEEDDLDKIQEPTSGNSSTSGDLGAAAAMPHVPPSGVNPLPFGSTGIHVPQGCQ